MLLSDVSVKRPVVAIVLSLLLCVFGAVSFSKLSVREMPDVENPVVTVMTTYDGASAQIMETQVTKAIEDQLSGISGIDEITSVTRNGMSRITVKFFIGWNLTEGVSDVRDAVARAQRRLPDEADDPVVSKDNGSGEPSIYVNLSSTEMDRIQLTDYADRVLEKRFSLISGVSSVDYGGALYKVMYLQLDPQLMAGRGVTTTDIVAALNAENLENPGGEIRNDTTVMPVRTARMYQTAEDFEYLVVQRTAKGDSVYLKDVAKVFVGAQNDNSTYTRNGEVNLSLGIVTQSDANPLDVAQQVYKEVDRIQAFLPIGTQLEVSYDSTRFIDQSIDEVYQTILVTAGLVVLVLYLFLGQARATLIPAVTVPVSLISAFMAAYLFGFSINLLTLMALILAIGLVVDDAIVVVENIFHHIKQGKPPLLAAYDGTKEVGFAVVATTAVLVMVFLPIAFMDGMVGLLFTEFSVVLAMSVIFSSVVALSLAPVLGSKVLKGQQKPNRLIVAIDCLFDKLSNRYRSAMAVALRLRWLAPVIIIACIAGSAWLVTKVPAELTPKEDRGVIFAFIKGAEGTSFNRMAQNVEQVEARLLPLVGQGVVKAVSIQAPAFGGRAGDETGFVILLLEEWAQREVTAQQALGLIRESLKGLPDIKVWPMLPGFRGGSSDPVQFVLAGSDYQTLFKEAKALKQLASDSGLMTGVDLDYDEITPELLVRVDRERAAELGISVDDVATTLEVMLGGRTETTFVDRGEEYDVYLRGNERHFQNSADLSQIYLRTSDGQMVTLDTVTIMEEFGVADRLGHTNKQKSITIKASLNDGVTLGQALAYLDAQAAEQLPSEVSVDYTGESKDFKENQSATAVVFGLALLVAYLVLAAQFESFINPIVVMFTVPMGIVGGLLGLVITGQGLNIYSQIGMIMLIGMVTKNGILIVEFANQLRDKGLALEQAITEAAVRRLRPILMTAMTTLFGAVPLILSTGAGYESRVAVGTVVFSGMALATLVTLFVIPAMYRLISGHTKSPGHVAATLAKQQREFS